MRGWNREEDQDKSGDSARDFAPVVPLFLDFFLASVGNLPLPIDDERGRFETQKGAGWLL